MAALTHIDTHVVVWLYLDGANRLSAPATAALEASSPRVSPIVLLELSYLQGINRLEAAPAAVVDHLRDRLGLRVDDTPFPDVIEVAATLTWTRDPFDRVIAAQALVANAGLVTRDTTIRSNLSTAIW